MVRAPDNGKWTTVDSYRPAQTLGMRSALPLVTDDRCFREIEFLQKSAEPSLVNFTRLPKRI